MHDNDMGYEDHPMRGDAASETGRFDASFGSSDHSTPNSRRRSSIGAPTPDGLFFRANFSSTVPRKRRSSIGGGMYPTLEEQATSNSTVQDPLAVARQRVHEARSAAITGGTTETETMKAPLFDDHGVPLWKKKLLDKKRIEQKATMEADASVPGWKKALLEKKRKDHFQNRQNVFGSASPKPDRATPTRTIHAIIHGVSATTATNSPSTPNSLAHQPHSSHSPLANRYHRGSLAQVNQTSCKSRDKLPTNYTAPSMSPRPEKDCEGIGEHLYALSPSSGRKGYVTTCDDTSSSSLSDISAFTEKTPRLLVPPEEDTILNVGGSTEKTDTLDEPEQAAEINDVKDEKVEKESSEPETAETDSSKVDPKDSGNTKDEKKTTKKGSNDSKPPCEDDLSRASSNQQTEQSSRSGDFDETASKASSKATNLSRLSAAPSRASKAASVKKVSKPVSKEQRPTSSNNGTHKPVKQTASPALNISSPNQGNQTVSSAATPPPRSGHSTGSTEMVKAGRSPAVNPHPPKSPMSPKPKLARTLTPPALSSEMSKITKPVKVSSPRRKAKLPASVGNVEVPPMTPKTMKKKRVDSSVAQQSAAVHSRGAVTNQGSVAATPKTPRRKLGGTGIPMSPSLDPKNMVGIEDVATPKASNRALNIAQLPSGPILETPKSLGAASGSPTRKMRRQSLAGGAPPQHHEGHVGSPSRVVRRQSLTGAVNSSSSPQVKRTAPVGSSPSPVDGTQRRNVTNTAAPGGPSRPTVFGIAPKEPTDGHGTKIAAGAARPATKTVPTKHTTPITHSPNNGVAGVNGKKVVTKQAPVAAKPQATHSGSGTSALHTKSPKASMPHTNKQVRSGAAGMNTTNGTKASAYPQQPARISGKPIEPTANGDTSKKALAPKQTKGITMPLAKVVAGAKRVVSGKKPIPKTATNSPASPKPGVEGSVSQEKERLGIGKSVRNSPLVKA